MVRTDPPEVVVVLSVVLYVMVDPLLLVVVQVVVHSVSVWPSRVNVVVSVGEVVDHEGLSDEMVTVSVTVVV